MKQAPSGKIEKGRKENRENEQEFREGERALRRSRKEAVMIIYTHIHTTKNIIRFP